MAAAKYKSAKTKRFVNNTIVHVSLAILAFIWVFPIIWVVLTSFRAEKGSYVSTFLPRSYTLDNYIKLFTDTSILNFPRMFMNTLIIAIFSCLIATFYTLAVSYCLSRLKFKLRKHDMNMAMILGLFPGFMSMVAVYFILKAAGLTEGNLIRVALILCYSGGAGLGFQIAKGFFHKEHAGRAQCRAQERDHDSNKGFHLSHRLCIAVLFVSPESHLIPVFGMLI